MNSAIDSWDRIKLSENVALSKFADVKGSWDDNNLLLEWTTEQGVKGFCNLPCSQASKPSKLKPLKKNWKTYKEHVLRLEGKRFLFRGQAGPWRLRTSYHRTHRADINRFLEEDIPTLHRHLSARTKHIFNFEIPDEYGAFFNLIQHHGYPTPLLDWSRSPYVAAYFAYRNITNEIVGAASPKDKVRILVFDQALWKADMEHILTLKTSKLHVSVHEFMAIENERLIPQQAVSTITNVDDMESHILSNEHKDRKYLWAIDLPISDRSLVVEELRYMGITAGSLFPGLDGACEELKERNFAI
jgi:FRG domain